MLSFIMAMQDAVMQAQQCHLNAMLSNGILEKNDRMRRRTEKNRKMKMEVWFVIVYRMIPNIRIITKNQTITITISTSVRSIVDHTAQISMNGNKNWKSNVYSPCRFIQIYRAVGIMSTMEISSATKISNTISRRKWEITMEKWFDDYNHNYVQSERDRDSPKSWIKTRSLVLYNPIHCNIIFSLIFSTHTVRTVFCSLDCLVIELLNGMKMSNCLQFYWTDWLTIGQWR